MLDSIKTWNRGALILLLLPSLLGIAFVLYYSRYGLGTTGDSIHYLMGAQNLLEGEGFGRTTASGEVQSITMLPPIFSFELGAFGLAGLDMLEWARILHALFFGASIFLVGTLLYRQTNSIISALLGGFLILFAETEVQFHGWLMPEAIYIFVMLLALIFIIEALESGKRSWLIGAGLLAAGATLTRYIGLSLIATGAVSLLLFSQHGWRRRLADAVLFSTIGLVPFILWLRRNATVAGTLVNRELGFHLIDVELIRAYRAEISYWFIPARLGLPHALRRAIMAFLALVGPAIFFAFEVADNFKQRVDPRKGFWRFPWVLTVYAIAYGATLFFNLTILDAVIDFNVIPRYLAPIFVIVVILLVVVYHRLVVIRLRQALPQAIVLVVGVGLVMLYALDTVAILREPSDSLGYTGLMLEREETLERLDQIDRNAPIISNDPELVYFFARRPAYIMPIRFDFNTRQERDDFEQQVDATRRKLEDGGMLVLFAPIGEKDLETIDILGAELMDSFYGSSFYAYPEAIHR